MSTTTFDKVKKIIVEQLGVDESEVTTEASITDDLGADSLDQVELVMAFETEFNKLGPIGMISKSNGNLLLSLVISTECTSVAMTSAKAGSF